MHPKKPITRPRILLYSHDSVGLGHLRRTLTLAQSLSENLENASFIVASGSEASLRFELPRGLEVVKLPSVGKGAMGEYTPRRLPGELGSLVRIRRALLLELVESYRPHLLVVDNKVLGVAGELQEALDRQKELGGRSILGLRDIIDRPEVVAREWDRPDIRRALIKNYDAVCVYGAPEVFDMRREYPVPRELAQILHYVGYVVRPRKGLSFLSIPRLRPQLLVTMGGGEDGAERVERCLDALALKAPAFDTVVVLGPLLDATRTRQIKRRARGMDFVTIHGFYEDMPRLFEASTAAVSMAGYNTMTELIRGRIPTVLLPRKRPREEQFLRAERFAKLGLGEVLDTPSAEDLRAAMERALARGKVQGWLPKLDGDQHFATLVRDLLGLPRSASTPSLPCDSRIS
jgi:predicted glycosyltransferase